MEDQLNYDTDSDESENIAQPLISQKSAKNNESSFLSQISRDGKQMDKLLTGHKTSTPFVPNKLTFNKQAEREQNALNEIQNFGNTKRKRLEDLFGDLYDIDDEDDLALMKKQKTDEERDLDTIQRIVDARQVFESNQNPMKKNNFDRYATLNKFKKDNLTTTIPKYTFARLSKNEFEIIYIRLHTEELESHLIKDVKAHSLSKGSFFGNQSEGIWQDANKIVSKEFDENTLSNVRFTEELSEINYENTSVDLWVEKYRPKKYIELLSEESINRSLLHWLKLWDKVVFNREISKKSKNAELNNFNKKTGRFEINGGWQRRKQSNLNTDLDEHGIPIQKIVLLAGKPGTGKTTLAHVIAKHAGYEVREVNASDDRQVENFKHTLETCTQMQSVLNHENRPNCIILDEIDGAPTRSVEFLIRFVTGQITEKSKRGNNRKKILVKRPIICICNDLYGANLRQLRQMAFAINFNSIDNTRLAERLMQIANREYVKTDLTTMLALAEKSDGDIRSCISVIQFYNNMNKPLTLIDILKSNIGQKDQHKTLFNCWSSIFQIQRPKKMIKQSETNDQKHIVAMSDSSFKRRMTHILEMVNSCGEYEKLSLGVYENFPRQKFSDSNMEIVVDSTSWFCFNDLVTQKINSLQNYVIYPYLQFAFVSWHFNFATMKYPQITYPSKQFEVLQKFTHTKQVLESLKKGLSTSILSIRNGNVLLLDMISLLKIVICPEVRSVSMHLLSQKEKIELQHTVEIIADFGLSLIQLQSNDGTFVYRINPDIEHFSFSNISSKQISYWSKQLIAQQVEVEKMRRICPKVSAIENQQKVETKVSAEEEKATDDGKKKTSPTSANKMLPNFLQKLIPKPIVNSKPVPLVCKDFFGRIVTHSKSSSTTTSTSNNEGDHDNSKDVFLRSPIWLKFKEGFNNAVRTDVHFSDLL